MVIKESTTVYTIALSGKERETLKRLLNKAIDSLNDRAPYARKDDEIAEIADQIILLRQFESQL